MLAPMSSADKDLIDRLAEVPLFCETSKKQRRTLAKLGKVMEWKPGATPIKQGSRGAAFFLILEGEVDVVRDGRNVARLTDGDFVGEMALLDDAPRNADVTAVTATRVFAFGRPGLAAALKTEPMIGISLLKAMAGRRAAIG
jgi:CRP-like cAMP-binding protein